jgi:hypothetical protein
VCADVSTRRKVVGEIAGVVGELADVVGELADVVGELADVVGQLEGVTGSAAGVAGSVAGVVGEAERTVGEPFLASCWRRATGSRAYCAAAIERVLGQCSASSSARAGR